MGTIPTKPRIVLLTPIPAWKVAGSDDWPHAVNGDVIKNEIVPKIKQVALERNLPLIDLYTAFLPYESLVTDGVHPNAAGLDTLSRFIYDGLKDVSTAVVQRESRPRGLEGGLRAEDPDAAANGVMGKAHRPINPLAPLGTDAAGRRY